MKGFEISAETVKQYGGDDPGATGAAACVLVKDLQLGDWVGCLGDPVRVVSLSIKDDEPIGIMSPLKTIETFREEDVRPVPLTENILDCACEQDQRKDVEWYFFKHNPYQWRFAITGTQNDVDVQIAYVHEFQHVLRVCGLNEIARNLKV